GRQSGRGRVSVRLRLGRPVPAADGLGGFRAAEPSAAHDRLRHCRGDHHFAAAEAAEAWRVAGAGAHARRLSAVVAGYGADPAVTVGYLPQPPAQCALSGRPRVAADRGPAAELLALACRAL